MSEKTKKSFWIALSIVVVIAILSINAEENKEGYVEGFSEGYEVGDLAMNFDLPNINGSNVSLSDYPNSKGIIVIFTCNTCPYAKAYEQRIIELDKNYKSKGFPVIAINPNNVDKSNGDSMAEMIIRAKEKNYPFPYLRDDEQNVTRTYGAAKTPHVYLLNREESNKFRIEYIGAIDNSPRDAADATEKYVENAINALLKGEKPQATMKRAIGCTIKWNN